jgi:putative tryptophan/tyrosine transport system substrate-binding protein
MAIHLRRRQFIVTLGSAATWPLAPRAQQSMPVIGYLSSLTQGDSVRFDVAFRQG